MLPVRGETMELPFRDADLIFFDAQFSLHHGRFVLASDEDSSEATFKQLIVEDERYYLKALNPDWPERTTQTVPNATICGVIVFKGEIVEALTSALER